MALQKGRVAIPLSKGINQKVDPKQEPIGSLKELENIQIDKFGEIEKRDGYDKVQENYGYVTDERRFAIRNIQGITSFKDDLYILSDNKAMSNRTDLRKAIFEGRYSPAKIETDFLTQQNGFDSLHVNSVVKGNFLYSVYSYSTSSTTAPAYMVVKNIVDDTYLVNANIITSTNYSRPKIISLGDTIIKFAIEKDSTNYYVVYNIASPTDHSELISTSYNRLTQTHSDQIYDVETNEAGTAAVVVHKKITTGHGQAISVFLDPDPSMVGRDLQTESSFSSTAAINAAGVTAIPTGLRTDGAPLSSPDQGGFLVTFGNSTTIIIASLDEFGISLHVNTTFDSGTTWNNGIAPSAVIGTARDNEFDVPGNIAYDISVSYQLTATGTGTSSNVLFMVDNTTGTYATDTILASDFSGGSDYIKTEGSASTGFTGITYANFPSWNKQRLSTLRVFAVNTTGAISGITNNQYSNVTGSLVGKPFLVDNEPVLPLGWSSENQDSYYLYKVGDEDTSVNMPVGLISYGTADSAYPYDSTINGYSGVPSIAKYQDTYILPTLTKGRIESNDNSFYTLSVPSFTKITFDSNIANQSVEMSGNLILPGSQLFGSDQVRFNEFGFVQAPSRLYIHTEGMSSGGTVFASNTTRLYRAVYRYEDGSGNIHRSGLSPQLTVGLNAGYDHVNIIVPMLNFTAKYENATFIELYRTTNNGTLFYKVSDQALSSTVKASTNAKNFNYIKIKDTITDTDLQDNELLYTTGGVLENTPIGSASMVESYKNRVFLGGVEASPNMLYYSKSVQGNVFDTTPVEFNNLFSIEVPSPGGKVVALKKMDDKLIIFKERAIYMLTGEGPNNLGEQNDFIEPQLVTSDLGCKFANSVAFMPKGLMFMSQKGIYLLNRSLGLEYIGAPAEDYKDATITKATVVPKKDEVRFLASDGPTAIYNYFLNMWYTYTDHRGNSSCLVGDDYFLATYKDKVYKQVSTTASFGGAMVPMKVETGWLSFSGVQGFQRVYRMLLLGEYKSPHKLLIKVAYNYDDVWQQEKLIDVTSYTESYSYGNPSTGTQNTYGDPSGTDASAAALAYGGKDNTQYQIRLNFAKQKCESVKICIQEIEGSNPSGDAESAGPGFTLSNLSFIVGTKEGDFKIKQSRVFGSTSIT